MRVTECWRLKDSRYELKGAVDYDNQTVTFPPREVQPREVKVYDFNMPTADYVWQTEPVYAEAQR